MPPPDALEAARREVASAGYDPMYYLLVDQASNVAYAPYAATQDAPGRAVWALDEHGRRRELSELSPTIRALEGRRRQAINIFAPTPVIASVRRLLLPPELDTPDGSA